MRSIITPLSVLDLSSLASLIREVGFESDVAHATRILVKVNLCAGHRYKGHTGINVEPEVVLTVVQTLRSITKRHDAAIMIAETDSVGDAFAAEKFRFQGLDGAVQKLAGVSLLNLSEVRRQIVSCTRVGRARRAYEMPAVLWEADVIVNLGKIKTHNLSGITGALKGNFGMIPGDKSQYHPKLAEVIADLASVIPSRQLCILDGNPGMIGDGPVRGQAHSFNCVIVANHVVAADVALATVLGRETTEVKHLQLASRALQLSQSFGDSVLDRRTETEKWRAPGSTLERRFFLWSGLKVQLLGARIERFGHAVHGLRSFRGLLGGIGRRIAKMAARLRETE